MISAGDLESLTVWTGQCQQPLLLSHERPDGDSLGALAATALVLGRRGARPAAALYGPLPATYGFLATATTWHNWDQVRDVLLPECDAVIILDTCALSQLEPVAAFLARAPRMLVIDHHATRDPIALRAGDLRVFDDTASATCLMLAEWLRWTGLAFDQALATALLVGIATDTGWFRFSNTDARTLRTAAELVEAGADPNGLYDALYQRDPPARLALLTRALASLELKADGKLAVMYLRRSDFEATGADSSMTENLVNEAGRLASTEAALLFVEEPDQTVRVNFRSKRRLDVAALAHRFGGGGHTRAAGARLRGTWQQIVPRVIAETIEAL